MPAKKYATEEERVAARKQQRRAWFERNRELENERHRTRLQDPETLEKARASVRAYDEAHREERARKARERYAADPDAGAARGRRSRAKNPEKARQATRDWHAANPGAQRVYSAKRAGIIVMGDFTKQDWDELVEEFDGRCAYCSTKTKLEIEHMTPLSRGGQHTKSNIVPACRSCNATKGSRTLLESFALLDGLAA